MSVMSSVSSDTDLKSNDYQRSDKKSRSRKTDAVLNRRVLFDRSCHFTHDTAHLAEISARGLTTSFVTDSSRAVFNKRRVEVTTRANNDLASRHLSLYHSEERRSKSRQPAVQTQQLFPEERRVASRQPAVQQEQLCEKSDGSDTSDDEMGDSRATVIGPVTAVPHSVATALRDQLANYQDNGNNNFEYSFFNILKTLAKNGLAAMYSVFLIFVSLLPILAVFLHILRFFLDKLVDLLDGNNTIQEFMKKLALFAFQFLIIFGIMTFIVGSIFYPLYDMFVQVLRKVLFMI